MKGNRHKHTDTHPGIRKRRRTSTYTASGH